MGETFHGGLRDITWAQKHFPFVDLQMMIAWKHNRVAHAEAEIKSGNHKGKRGVTEGGLDEIKRMRRGGGVVQQDNDHAVNDYDDIAQFAGSLGF